MKFAVSVFKGCITYKTRNIRVSKSVTIFAVCVFIVIGAWDRN